MKLIIYILSLMFIFTACDEKKTEIVDKPVISTKTAVIDILNTDQTVIAKVLAEIADSDYARTKGLMHREHLAQNEGMLFIFAAEKMQSFWMKNTPISLDLIFIDENLKIVSISHQAQPYKTTPISSRFPAKYVLEVAGGYCDTYGIESGHVLSISYD